MKDKQQHINWTKDEWSKVAKRAEATKKVMPDKSWAQVVVMSQDDIAVERRRFHFTSPVTMKPMFDLLGLDELGNVKPPPPPPPPPPPAPPAVKSAPAIGPAMPAPLFKEEKPPPLGTVPSSALLAELFGRAGQVKALADKILDAHSEIMAELKTTREQVQAYMARVEAVEKTWDECVSNIDKVECAHRDVMETRVLVEQQYVAIIHGADKILTALGTVPPENRKTTLDSLGKEMLDEVAVAAHDFIHPPPREPTPRLAAIRFALVGLHQKDVAHIKEKLPRSLNVELLIDENREHIKLPANAHYCLVSGASEFTKRWTQALAVYGKDRVHRLANGSIGTFAHQIQLLSSLHHRHPASNGK